MFNIYIIKSLTTEQDLIDMFKEYNNIFLIEDTIIICKTYLQIIDAYQNHYELFKQHANTCFKFAKPLIHWFTFPNALHKIINVAEWVLYNLKQHQNFDNNFRLSNTNDIGGNCATNIIKSCNQTVIMAQRLNRLNPTNQNHQKHSGPHSAHAYD